MKSVTELYGPYYLPSTYFRVCTPKPSVLYLVPLCLCSFISQDVASPSATHGKTSVLVYLLSFFILQSTLPLMAFLVHNFIYFFSSQLLSNLLYRLLGKGFTAP
jgi:hypothetical protein